MEPPLVLPLEVLPLLVVLLDVLELLLVVPVLPLELELAELVVLELVEPPVLPELVVLVELEPLLLLDDVVLLVEVVVLLPPLPPAPPVPFSKMHCPSTGLQCCAPAQVWQAEPCAPQAWSELAWQAPSTPQQPLQLLGPHGEAQPASSASAQAARNVNERIDGSSGRAAELNRPWLRELSEPERRALVRATYCELPPE